jgi:hypothetical protein
MVNLKKIWLIDFGDGTNRKVKFASSVTKADIFMMYNGINGKRIKKAVIIGEEV